MASERLEWLDRMKGLLILLVVLGHVVGMGTHYSTGLERQIQETLYKFIYLFHMPAFFFLAGVTFKTKPIKELMRNKAVRLLIPYFVFGLASIIVYQQALRYFTGGATADGYYETIGWNSASQWWHPYASLLYGAAFPGTDGFRCNSVLWFLPCLFTVQVVLALVSRYGWKSEALSALVAFLAYVSLRRIGCPQLPWGALKVLHYLPFVVVGHLLSPLRWSERLKSGVHWVDGLLLLMLCGYVVLVPFAPFGWGMERAYGRWLVIVLFGIMGTLGAVLVAKCLKARILSAFGTASLGIMLIHKWPVLVCFKVGWTGTLLVFVLASSVSLCLTFGIRRCCPLALGEGGR